MVAGLLQAQVHLCLKHFHQAFYIPGAFTYYSYRDPNSLDTFSVFNQSTDWVLGDNFGQAEVEEAVLRVFQVRCRFEIRFPFHLNP